MIVEVAENGEVKKVDILNEDLGATEPEVVVNGNVYFIRIVGKGIRFCSVEPMEFINPPLAAQTGLESGIAKIRFLDRFGVSKRVAFLANLTLEQINVNETVPSASDVFAVRV
jgi:hypothetical protein